MPSLKVFSHKKKTKELAKESANNTVSSKPSISNSNNLKNDINSILHTYDVSLIGALENDHIQILALYRKALKQAREKDIVSLQLTLVEFATEFTNHIQIEDERLYSYLKMMASSKSSTEQKVVAKFSSEMKNISISIFSFLSQSPCIPVTEDNIEFFLEEFKQMGALLEERIEREEKILYPIYKSSRKVVDIS
jgi:regulator of sigma D